MKLKKKGGGQIQHVANRLGGGVSHVNIMAESYRGGHVNTSPGRVTGVGGGH